MIQVYSPDNENFEMNGDAVVNAESCELTMEMNSGWELELTAPVKENIDFLVEEAVIKVPTPYGRQLYRIYNLQKDDDIISANARPVFIDAKDEVMILDIRAVNSNGQAVMNSLFDPDGKYQGYSDIKKVSTAYWQQKNAIECLMSDDENSFLNRWGGEIYYDNFDIHINERIGSDNGLRAEFGFNLTGVEEIVDMSDIVTMIYPKAYNGYMLPDGETVNSPLLKMYRKRYKRIIEYSDIKLASDAQEDDEENGVTVCDTLEELYAVLRERANEEFVNGIDRPNITYSISMIDLSRTDEYKNYSELLRVALGDTVHVKHRRLGIVTNPRVIKMTYDCIREKVKNLILGDYEANCVSDLSSVMSSVANAISPGGTVMAEQIKGVIDLLNTSLRAQKDIAKRADVRAILFEDTDKDSPTFGAMSIGTQGIQLSKRRNETDTDWLWGTAIDFQTIYANFIIGGILSDRTGKSYWDLDSGIINLAGRFINYSDDGYKSVDINNNRIDFYAYNDNGNYVGSVLAHKRNSDGRVGISMYCDVGDLLALGYKTEGTNFNSKLEIDANKPSDPVLLYNTAEGKIFSDNPGGGIKIRNGLVTEWNITGMSGTITIDNLVMEFENGLLIDARS